MDGGGTENKRLGPYSEAGVAGIQGQGGGEVVDARSQKNGWFH